MEGVVTRQLDAISQTGNRNEPVFSDHVEAWIQPFIEASRHDDHEDPVLKYRPVELTVHARGEANGPIHALFPLDGAPTRQLYVCRKNRRVWQHHTTRRKASLSHDPWLSGDYRIIAQRELAPFLHFTPEAVQGPDEEAQEPCKRRSG